jgi:hypothetical protein
VVGTTKRSKTAGSLTSERRLGMTRNESKRQRDSRSHLATTKHDYTDVFENENGKLLGVFRVAVSVAIHEAILRT